MAIHEPKQNTDHALATSTKQHIIGHAAQKHSAMDFTVFFKLFSDSEGVRSVFPITAIASLPESAMVFQSRACALATFTGPLGVCARARVRDIQWNINWHKCLLNSFLLEIDWIDCD